MTDADDEFSYQNTRDDDASQKKAADMLDQTADMLDQTADMLDQTAEDDDLLNQEAADDIPKQDAEELEVPSQETADNDFLHQTADDDGLFKEAAADNFPNKQTQIHEFANQEPTSDFPNKETADEYLNKETADQDFHKKETADEGSLHQQITDSEGDVNDSQQTAGDSSNYDPDLPSTFDDLSDRTSPLLSYGNRIDEINRNFERDETNSSDFSELVQGEQPQPNKRQTPDKNDQPEDGHNSRGKELTANVSERWDMIGLLQSAEDPTIYHSPDWSKPMVEAATFMITKTGAPEMFPVGPNITCMDEAVLAGIIDQFSTMPLDRIHHYALNGEFMYALYRDRRLVDILIHIEDKIYYGHRNVLCTHSSYFAAILIDNDVPPYKVTDVTLTAVDHSLFKLFLHFAYTGDIFVTHQNLLPLKNLANALQSPTLRARLLLFMSKMSLMTLPEALYILCNHLEVDDTPLALEVVKMNFKTVLNDVDSLGRLTMEDFLDIISSSNICVNSELDVFWAVLFWVASDSSNRVNHLNKLMTEVRFTNMSSLELLDCARVSRLVRLSKVCKTLLVTANWVCHARELGLEDPLGLPLHPKRHCLYDQPHYEPTVAEFDHRFLVYSKLMCDTAGESEKERHRTGVTFESVDDIARFVYPREDESSDEGPLSSDIYDISALSEDTPADSTEPPSHGSDLADSDQLSKLEKESLNKAIPPVPATKPKRSLRSRFSFGIRGKSMKGEKEDVGAEKKKSPLMSRMYSKFGMNIAFRKPDKVRAKSVTQSQSDNNRQHPDKKARSDDSVSADTTGSHGSDDPNKDTSMNAPDISHTLSIAQCPLDPITLWESNLPPSRQITLTGGSLLQPIKLHKTASSRDSHQRQEESAYVGEDGITTSETVTSSLDIDIISDVTRSSSTREISTQNSSRHDGNPSGESPVDTSGITARCSTKHRRRSPRPVTKLRHEAYPTVDLMFFD